MMKKYLSMLAIAGAVMVGFSACGDDDKDGDNGTEVKDASLEVSAKSVYFSNAAEEETIKVKANGSWKVTCDADWLNVSPLKGSDDQTITIEADANKGSEREATIKITLGDLTQKIKVTQSGVKVYSFKDVVEKVTSLGSREIRVAKGDTIVYSEHRYWDWYNDEKAGPYMFYLIVTEATNEKISFKYTFHGEFFDHYNALMKKESKNLYEDELSDAAYEKDGYQAFGSIGIDTQTGSQNLYTYEHDLGYESVRFFFEKKKGEPVLTNYPSRKFPTNTDTTEDYDYPVVTFMKVGVQK